MQQMKKFSLILLSVAMVVGCSAFGGDMIIRVSGSVPVFDMKEKSTALCQLGMISAEAGEQGVMRNVPADFSTTMMVVADPRAKAYYFSISCNDGSKFRSNELIISSRSSYSRKFDLELFAEHQGEL